MNADVDIKTGVSFMKPDIKKMFKTVHILENDFFIKITLLMLTCNDFIVIFELISISEIVSESDTVNNNRYNPYKQNSLSCSVIFNRIKET